MAISEKDPPVFHVVQQFEVKATGSRPYPWLPFFKVFLKTPHLLLPEGHLDYSNDHDLRSTCTIHEFDPNGIFGAHAEQA